MKYDFILPYKSFVAFFANDPHNFDLKDVYCTYEYHKKYKAHLNLKNKKLKDSKRFKIGFNFFDTIRYIFSKRSLEQYRFKYHNESYNKFIEAMHETVEGNKEKYKNETENAIDKIYKDKESTIERLKRTKTYIDASKYNYKYNEVARQLGMSIPSIMESTSIDTERPIVLENKKQKKYRIKSIKRKTIPTVNVKTYMNIKGKTYQLTNSCNNGGDSSTYTPYNRIICSTIDEINKVLSSTRNRSEYLNTKWER